MGNIKELSKDEFRKMQLMQLDMLKDFDRVCRKHNIKYTIFGGTLLGAVRHKGYIPWDDDADVAMLREEYNKFKKVAHELNGDICFFQDHDTDPEYLWGYGKLRRTNTKYVRIGQEHIKCKTGFFIDIFPMDDIPKTTVGQMLNDFYCFILRKIIYAQVGKISSSSLLQKFMYNILSKISVDSVYKKVNRITKKSNNVTSNRVRVLLYQATGKIYVKNSLKTRYGMPKKWFTDLKEYDFEGYKFYGTKDYDDYLTYVFGDYMELPPEDKREPHAPVSEYSFDTRGK